jgi:Uma2 family endonuclease
MGRERRRRRWQKEHHTDYNKTGSENSSLGTGMTATLTPPEQATKTIILDNISWETYQRLLADRGERAKPRYAYDCGRLEIMVSSFEHENLKHDIATLVEVIAEELQLDLVGAASTTFDREDLTQGFEPDACFYLQDAARVRGRKRIDLAVDPPLSPASASISRLRLAFA